MALTLLLGLAAVCSNVPASQAGENARDYLVPAQFSIRLGGGGGGGIILSPGPSRQTAPAPKKYYRKKSVTRKPAPTRRTTTRKVAPAPKQVVRRTPGPAELASANLQKGLALASAGQFEQAITEYDKAIRLNPRDATLFDLRAHSYEALGRRDEAQGNFQAALALDPTLQSSIEGLNRLMSTPSAPAAVAAPLPPAGEQTLAATGGALPPGTPGASSPAVPAQDSAKYMMKALEYSSKGDLANANIELETAIMHDPTNAMLYDLRGQNYEALGLKQEAISDYKQAVNLDPNAKRSADALKRLEAKIN